MKRLLVLQALLLAACTRAPQAPLRFFPLEEVWTAPLESPVVPPLASDGARVFVVAEASGLAALDSGTGDVVWRAPELTGRPAATVDALYLLEPSGVLWCLDPLNGRRRWRVDTGIPDARAPVVDGSRVFVVGAGAAAYEALAGRPVWAVPGDRPAIAPPAMGAGLLVTTEPGGRLHCRDALTGRTLWTRVLGPDLVAPPAVGPRGRVFIGTLQRAFLGLDGLDEGKTRWRWPVGTDIRHAALPLGDRVVMASLENVLYALKSGGGDMVWRQGLPGRPLAGPALVGGALLLATQDGHLLGYAPANGRALGNMRLEGEIAAPPIVVGDRFVAALRTRTVTAVRISGPPPDAPLPGQP